MSATVYRVRLVIGDEDFKVELHRSARAAGYEAATWARKFPEAQVVIEGLPCPDDELEATEQGASGGG